MTYEQIETFLTVITYGNISAAAKKLFVSQSTVSSRIQLLEEELGTQLLVRSRGQRTIELTNAGSAFVSLAGQWSSLWKETRQLKTIADIRSLTIAGVDALNNFTFVPLFNSYIDRHPETKLTVRTHHSDEIHDLVERRTADIGFVFSQVRYPDIISKPVYRELMYLLCQRTALITTKCPVRSCVRKMKCTSNGERIRRNGTTGIGVRNARTCLRSIPVPCCSTICIHRAAGL